VTDSEGTSGAVRFMKAYRGKEVQLHSFNVGTR